MREDLLFVVVDNVDNVEDGEVLFMIFFKQRFKYYLVVSDVLFLEFIK